MKVHHGNTIATWSWSGGFCSVQSGSRDGLIGLLPRNRGHLPGDEMIYLVIYLYVAGVFMSLYDVITEDDSPDMLTLGAALLWPVMLPIALIWPLK